MTRRWQIVRRIRSHYGLPCLPGACIRTGQFAANCICYQNYLEGGER